MQEAAEAVAVLDIAVAQWRGRSRLRRLECESAVRALTAVVLDVDEQDVFEVATAEDHEPVETFRSDVRTNRSAYAFACGACTGVWITVIPSLRNTSSEEAVNLLSRSCIRKRIRSKRP